MTREVTGTMGRATARTSRTTRRIALAVVVPALALTAACGDGDEDEADDAAATADDATAEASAEPSGDASAGASDAAAGENLADTVACDATEGAVIGYSQPLPDPNYEAISATIDNVLAEYGATQVAVNANLDPGKQISDVQSLIQQDVDVILINPVAPEPVFPAFDAIREAGIPLIAQDTDRGGPFFATVRADNEFAAREGARILSEEVGDGQVVAINGPEFAEVLVLRNETFAAAAGELGVNVVDTQVNQQITPDGARQIADAWVQQYGEDIAGLWAFNDVSAVGASGAFDPASAPVIVSMNGEPQAIPLVEQGVITATWDLQQEKIGQAMAYAALGAICGVEVPADITVPALEVNADNVGDWRPLEERTADPFVIAFEERDGRTYLATE